MAQKYYSLSQSESDFDEEDVSHSSIRSEDKRQYCRLGCAYWKYFVVLLAGASYIFPFVYTIRDLIPENVPDEYARTEPLTTVWKQFWWNTKYSPKNHTESDELWEAILPSHGFVAMDREWAAKNQWPVSMYLPSDRNKGVYLLEAYHQIHCLRIIRKTFWEAVEHRPFTYHPLGHIEHCFDTLRQAVQCNADNTPLYTFGDKTAGNGQLHRCKNWDELRDFATKHTACYRDSVEDIPLGEHFGFCDTGKDGLEGAF